MAANVDAGPCLEDILSHHGLEKKDLQRQCPPGIRIKIATKLVDWKTTGHYFGVPAEKLAAIDRENTTEDQRRIALLDCWEKREGRNASCLKLADVLHRRDRRDLVELLCTEMKLSLTLIRKDNASSDGKQLQSCASGIDIAKRIDTLQKQFRSLHRRLLTELNEERVSVDDLLAELTLLPIECCKEYESLIQQKLPTLEESNRITTLFNRLNPLFTFIDYGLLQHLISNLGSTELKEDMTSYIDEVQEFMRETTVGDVIDYWPGEKVPHMNYSELKVKFKDDPKTYTLERLNNFRRKFCSRIRLSEFIFGLISLEPSESFFVTWLIPTVVVPKVKKSVCQIECNFYESEHIFSISADQEQIYELIASLSQASIFSPQSPKQKPPEVPQAGDLITPMLTPKSTIAKKDTQPKESADNTVNIIVIGWEGASRFAEGIIGHNKNNNLKLWDCSDIEYHVPYGTDMKEKEEELQMRVQKCQVPDLVLLFDGYATLDHRVRRLPTSEPEEVLRLGITISDLTKLLGQSIWNNAVIVKPFKEIIDPLYSFGLTRRITHDYEQHLREGVIKPKYKWRNIDPEVVSAIPIVPVNIVYPSLPDRIDWLSPFWDMCLQRMTESAQHTFLRANADRIKLATTGQKREDSHEPLHEQAIFYVPGLSISKVPVHFAVSSLLGTEVAGPLGKTSFQLPRQDKDKTSLDLTSKKTTN